MKWVCAFLLAGTVSSTCCAAEGQPAPPTPQWERLPDAADMTRYYPDRAARAGVGGSAKMDCAVGPGDGKIGGLEDCHLIDESPADMGFGQALLSMASLFKMRIRDPSNVGKRVVIPVRFNPPLAR